MLLVVCILSGSLLAQRTGGAFRGNAAGPQFHSGSLGQGSFPNGSHSRRHGFVPKSGFSERHFHVRHQGFGTVLVPYFYPYEESFGYEQPYPDAVESEAAPPVFLAQSEEGRLRTPAIPAAKPQLIEIPRSAPSAPVKPVPPTVFILKNGERLEAPRYVFTASKLSLNTGRQQRIIAFDMLDVNATVRANRERGLDLQIPSDRSEISLSY